MRRFLLLAALTATWIHAAALTAAFGSEEGEIAAYSCNFDNAESMAGWTMAGWTLTQAVHLDQADLKPFSTVNPSSKASAVCTDLFKEQDEAMLSPEISLPADARLRFYAAFSELFGVWGHMEVSVVCGSDRQLLLNSFLWSQEDGNEGGRWVPFAYDLSAYAGRKVRIEFRYINVKGGDNVYIDDMAVVAPDTSADAVINVTEGSSVHFQDMSEGATEWNWSFPGGEPSASTERNPVVKYAVSGTYDVALTVKDASGATATVERKGYVVVKIQTPTARIGLPAGTYYSPWTMRYVPVGTEITYTDMSIGGPTQWEWSLPGTLTEESTEQNPSVVYKEAGTYGLSLRAGNAAGSTLEEFRDAIQAGGEQYVWNIAPEENSDIKAIAMGWYGNYGGSNWLGLGEFAELFDAPAAAGTISEVQCYFAKTAHVAASADLPLSVSVRKVDADGAPGDVLASTSLPVKELVDGGYDYAPTTFAFPTPAKVAAGEPFFVVIGPFPNNEGDSYYDMDDIALFCSPRRSADTGGTSTVWHFAYDEDPDGYDYLETGKWYYQEDELVSLAVSPLLEFEEKEVGGIAEVAADESVPVVELHGDTLIVAGDAVVYSIDGLRVASGNGAVYVGHLSGGVYVVRTSAGAVKIAL